VSGALNWLRLAEVADVPMEVEDGSVLPLMA